MADIQARLAAASDFILQSPPGEVNDVFNDVRALVGDDEALETGILPALEKYNVEQYVVADLPEGHGQLLICEAGRMEEQSNGARFIEPKTSKGWTFDHLRLAASDPIDIHVDEACEAIRSQLETAAESYISQHFSDGVCKVFTTEQTKPKPQKRVVESSAGPDAEAAQTSSQEPEPTPESQPVTATDAAESAETSMSVDQHPEKTDADAPSTAAEADSEMTGADEPSTGEEAAAQSTEESTEAVDEPVPAAEQPETAVDKEEGPQDIDVDAPNVEAAAVEPEPESEPEPAPLPKKFSLFFVGNKYNPSNYWTGRWRSSYSIDATGATPTLSGTVQLNVHFFEQGNVQLSTKYLPELQLPTSLSADASPAEFAKAVLKVIAKAEEEYQLELNDAYRETSEKTFRSLRRALPVTRQKMDWAKVANYRLGRDLGASREQ